MALERRAYTGPSSQYRTRVRCVDE